MRTNGAVTPPHWPALPVLNNIIASDAPGSSTVSICRRDLEHDNNIVGP